MEGIQRLITVLNIDFLRIGGYDSSFISFPGGFSTEGDCFPPGNP
jgi:hypothetical protein